MKDSAMQVLEIIVAGYIPALIIVFWMTTSDFKVNSEIQTEMVHRGRLDHYSYGKDLAIFLAHGLVPGWNILVALLLLGMDTAIWLMLKLEGSPPHPLDDYTGPFGDEHKDAR